MNDRQEAIYYNLRAWRESDPMRGLLTRYLQADKATRRGHLERCWITVEVEISGIETCGIPANSWKQLHKP